VTRATHSLVSLYITIFDKNSNAWWIFVK